MKRQAAKSAHLLLLVDKSPASKRMVAYVAGIIGRRRNFHVHLLYLMPYMPVQLLETGGAENPKKEEEVNTDLHQQQGQWVTSAEAAAKPALDELAVVMRKAGIPSRAIDVEFTDPYESGSPDRSILGFASERQCHTIVIGHDSHSWFHEMTGGHLTEHLFRHAKGATLWIVQ